MITLAGDVLSSTITLTRYILPCPKSPATDRSSSPELPAPLAEASPAPPVEDAEGWTSAQLPPVREVSAGNSIALLTAILPMAVLDAVKNGVVRKN